MSSTLIPVVVALTVTPNTPTSTGAAWASTNVVVTDSTGNAQAPVVLTGSENPPWSFQTSVAAGNGTVVATAVDVNGATLATVSQTFTEAGTPPTFSSPTAITVTPVAVQAQVAAARTLKR
jgi:hypothetical protein